MLLIREARRLSPKHLQEMKKTWRRGFEVVRDSIKDLQRQQRCRADVNPTFAAFAAIGMASWIAYWFDATRPQSAEAVAQTITDIFSAGLVAGPLSRSRATKRDIAVPAPLHQPRSGARKAEGTQAKRRA
jgi:Tetracyclin repressor-like, C-terminal domain